MNPETLEKLKNAASLACTLRNLLEEIEQELKEQGGHELAWDFEDMASSVSMVEGDLDVHVESFS
jgi:hypothetical protein